MSTFAIEMVNQNVINGSSMSSTRIRKCQLLLDLIWSEEIPKMSDQYQFHCVSSTVSMSAVFLVDSEGFNMQLTICTFVHIIFVYDVYTHSIKTYTKYVCVCVHAWVCVHTCVCACMCVCACIDICYVCVHTCMCVL